MLRSLFIQALIFFLAFQALSFFRESSMLSTNSQFNATPISQFDNVTTLMGDTVSLNAMGKTKVLYFFAPWCQVCHVSIANLQNLYQKNEHIEVVAIVMDYTDTDEVLAFTKQHQLTFPIALGSENIKDVFSITGYPSYYVLNDQNIITARSMGYSSQLGLYLRTL